MVTEVVANFISQTPALAATYQVRSADPSQSGSFPKRVNIAVLLPSVYQGEKSPTRERGQTEQAYRYFLRCLPFKRGLVVAYGRDPFLRRVTKRFAYHFRWFDEEHLWPGLALTQQPPEKRLQLTAAARLAHELGLSNSTIKNLILKSHAGI